MTDTEGAQRAERFRRDIAAAKISTPAPGRERGWAVVGVVAMLAGIGVAIGAYVLSHSTTDPLQQRDALVVALIGVTLSVSGGALFLRYSLAGFLRFWLARFVFEQQAIVDRVRATPPE